MEITGVNTTAYTGTKTNVLGSSGKSQNTGKTYKNSREYKNYLTQKFDCLRSKEYSVAINSFFLSEAMGDEKKAHWLEYNLALIPETVEKTKAQVEARGAKILSYSITINGYDSMSAELCTQVEADPGTEEAREKLEEILEKKQEERRAEEKEREQKVAEQTTEKVRQYNMRFDGKDVEEITWKMANMVSASEFEGVTKCGHLAFDVRA